MCIRRTISNTVKCTAVLMHGAGVLACELERHAWICFVHVMTCWHVFLTCSRMLSTQLQLPSQTMMPLLLKVQVHRLAALTVQVSPAASGSAYTHRPKMHLSSVNSVGVLHALQPICVPASGLRAEPEEPTAGASQAA